MVSEKAYVSQGRLRITRPKAERERRKTLAGERAVAAVHGLRTTDVPGGARATATREHWTRVSRAH